MTGAEAALVAPAPAAAPGVASYQLTVETSPPDARVFVDGKPVSGTPAVAVVTADTEHSVRVERDGHQPSVRAIRVSEDTVISLVLPELAATPKVSAPKPGKYVVSRPARTRAPAPAPAQGEAESASCDPPFYFSNGIKNYKPGCI